MMSEYQTWVEESGDATGDGVAESIVPSSAELKKTRYCESFGRSAIIGSPETVLAQLLAAHEDSPGTHLTLMMSLPGAEPSRTRHSMELFASEVMPRLKAQS